MSKEEWKRISLTLTEEADGLLRQDLKRRGDLGKRFNEAVTNTNFAEITVPLYRKRGQRFYATSIAMPVQVINKLKEHARRRGVPISALVDAIIISYCSKESHPISTT